ncbi:hypothetical protein PSHT_06668 [Puccinia striiformis]|uniref:Uncharacterized protein n=1 Tax=Puccinia striiformis TaxID=27350 RepID=A0A2S4W4P4_9BASI|nr:hypothetical protein PSHT_06668 [Puccinia striiformis]
MSDFITSSQYDSDDNPCTPAPNGNLNQRRSPSSRTTSTNGNSQLSQAGPLRNTERRQRLRQEAPPLRGSVAARQRVNGSTTGRPASIPPIPGQSSAVPNTGAIPAVRLNLWRGPTTASRDPPTFPNHPMNPVFHENEPVTNAFLGELETVYELHDGYADMAENMALVVPPRQFAVQMYSQMALRQALDRVQQDLRQLARTPAVADPPSNALARDFSYLGVFGDYVSRKARQLLMTRNLKMYSSKVQQGTSIPNNVRGLLNIVMDAINAKPAWFKDCYLPRGYNDADPTAVGDLVKFVRGKLRNSRGKMRDLLLTGILGSAGDFPVPTISALLAELNRGLLLTRPSIPRNDKPIAQVAPRGNQTHLKARLAYLRVQTIVQLNCTEPRDAGKQWIKIDAHLRELDAKGREYRTGFFQLVLEYNGMTFGQSTWAEMDPSTIKLPTDEEVHEHMARILHGDMPLEED